MKQIPSVRRLILTSVSLGTLLAISTKVIHLIIKVAVSRSGVSSFGNFYLVTSLASNLTTIALLGIPMSITRFISLLRGKRQGETCSRIVSTALLITLASASLAGLVTFFGAQVFAEVIRSPESAPHIRIVSGSIPAMAVLTTVQAVLYGYLLVPSALAIESVNILLRSIGTIIGLHMTSGSISGAIAGYSVGTIIALSIVFVIYRRYLSINPSGHNYVLPMLAYSWPVSLSEIISAANTGLLLIALRFLGSSESTGLFAAAVTLASLIQILPRMMEPVFLPVIGEMYGSGGPLRGLYYVNIAVNGVVVIPASLLVVSMRSGLLATIFGDVYAVTGGLLPILIASYAIQSVYLWPSRKILDIIGKTGHTLALTIIRTLASVATVMALHRLGANTAVSYALLAGTVTESVACWFICQRMNLLH